MCTTPQVFFAGVSQRLHNKYIIYIFEFALHSYTSAQNYVITTMIKKLIAHDIKKLHCHIQYVRYAYTTALIGNHVIEPNIAHTFIILIFVFTALM